MFLMIITRKGSLIPKVFFDSAGHVMYVVLKTQMHLSPPWHEQDYKHQ